MGVSEAELVEKAIVEEHACNWENVINLYIQLIESCLNSNNENVFKKHYTTIIIICIDCAI